MRYLILSVILMTFIQDIYSQKNGKTAPIVCQWKETVFPNEKALLPRLFFAYTPDELQKYFKSNDYLSCEGYISNENSKFFLHLNISIYDEKAEKQWGSIDQKSTITIFSIKGKAVTLKTEQGAVSELKNGICSYKCSFSIPKTALKKLKNFEVASILINWSRGFQTFEVNYLDFFIHQFRCFGL